MTPAQWGRLFETHRARFEKMASDYFRNPDDAKEALAEVLARYTESGWNKLKSWKETGTADAFLVCCIRTSLLDIYREENGRCRPPEWVKVLGAIWVTVHKWLCCEKRDLAEAVSLLINKEVSASEFHARRAISQQRNNPDNEWCSEQRVRVRSLDAANEDGKSLYDVTESGDSVGLGHDEVMHLLDALSAQIEGDEDPIRTNPGRLERGTWKVLCQALRTTDSEAMILIRLVYVDGKSVAEAAKLRDLKPHQARYKIDTTLETWRNALITCGLFQAK